MNFTCGIKYFPFSCEFYFFVVFDRLLRRWKRVSDQLATSIFTFPDPLFIFYFPGGERDQSLQTTHARVLVSFNGWPVETIKLRVSFVEFERARVQWEKTRAVRAPGETQPNPNNDHALRAQAHRHQLAAGKRPRRRRSIDLDDPARRCLLARRCCAVALRAQTAAAPDVVLFGTCMLLLTGQAARGEREKKNEGTVRNDSLRAVNESPSSIYKMGYFLTRCVLYSSYQAGTSSKSGVYVVTSERGSLAVRAYVRSCSVDLSTDRPAQDT